MKPLLPREAKMNMRVNTPRKIMVPDSTLRGWIAGDFRVLTQETFTRMSSHN